MSERPRVAPTAVETSPKGSQSIDRALSIMTAFTMDRPTLMLKEICDLTSLTMPTAHRMAKTLQNGGFLQQNANTGHYHLGPAVLKLAQVILLNGNQGRLAALCAPFMEVLRNEVGETIGLHVAGPSGRVCVAEVESREMMKMSSGVGRVFPWNGGAASKVLLAGMTEPGRERALAISGLVALTQRTPTDIELLKGEIERAQTDGYAISQGEIIDGSCALAVPVRTSDGRTLGAINVAAPASRVSTDDMFMFLPVVRDVVRDIEDGLSGYIV